jgi:hypothetical protein
MRRARVEKAELVGAVSPHAGYIYCGLTQAHVYRSIIGRPTVVIIGPNHTGLGAPVSIMTAGEWKTPLGACVIDSELARAIMDNAKITEDFHAHSQEHSIEVQLPWLQHVIGQVRFVPISITTGDFETYARIGRGIADAIGEKNVIIIASSDFTHYGASYGYTPVTGSPTKVLGYIRDVDHEAAKRIVELEVEKFLQVIERHHTTICGAPAIATMLLAIKDRSKQGSLLHYSTSYEVSKDPWAIVGYCGIVFERKE